MRLQKVLITFIAVILTFNSVYAFSVDNILNEAGVLDAFKKYDKLSVHISKKIKKSVNSRITSVKIRINNHKIKRPMRVGVDRLEIIKPKFASTKIIARSEILDVDFTSQAPRGRWVLPYSEACEEASLIMINAFLNGENLNITGVESDIKSLVAWETERGYTVDIGTAEIADVIENFYGRSYEIYSGGDVSIKKMKELLSDGSPIIVPVAGQKLGNVNFIGAGPPYHVVAVVGYDDTYFYAHDPGTRNGKEYKYEIKKFFDAIHDWNGSKKTVLDGEKRFIIMK